MTRPSAQNQLTEFGRLRSSGLTAQLPRPDMERHIASFLSKGNVCVLATCRDGVPRATPIEYYSDGLTVFVAASRGTKIPNIEDNPSISVAIYNTPFTDWMDWYDVTGVQITSEPELLRYDNRPDDYIAALKVYDWRKYRRALGKADKEPRKTTIIRIKPTKIELRDLALMRKGFSPLQIWKQEQTQLKDTQ
ncbi:MAG: pyridoxamine 5'-phosphate oxidase family protein [Gammaproteobacteria bacterium]|jgi:predicted pyridoxine 5'-phosphate oxidase superfamily flavin-nucleotide-binding protein|nr:hypothetical protein [Chromatiales bacterium]MCP4927018.1 hypothetical protein [Gammaproteobacteria bacterium]MDP7420165.1 pyridoxamine 5'-phosphate oxidase family protein [Gammaproteobacteria bacterium]HJP39787.1 pyridoxamine 5'-phosphate oxidase family protein [Gammaproteobacteria bacterium]